MTIGEASANETIDLYIPDATPLLKTEPGFRSPLIAPVEAALELTKQYRKISTLPWARAQKTVSNGKNHLIAPLARTTAREGKFIWVAPIAISLHAFFSLHDPVHTFSEAKARYKRIGVGLGTAQIEILLARGFSRSQLVELKLGDTPAQLLAKYRIDAWFTEIAEGRHVWLDTIGQLGKLKVSQPLATTNLYLACSLDCSPALVKDLREALSKSLGDLDSLEKIKNYNSLDLPE